MHMIFTHNPLENPNILSITDLDYEFTTSFLNLSFENPISILGNLDDMHRETADRVTSLMVRC